MTTPVVNRERRSAEASRPTEHEALMPYDVATFAALVEHHRRWLRGHCYRMLKSSDEADDAVQQALLHAWRARASFAGEAPFGSWLSRIATNVCLDELDRKRRRARPHRIADLVVPVDGCPEGQPDAVAPCRTEPDAVVAARESLALACLILVAVLPPRQRAVLILRDVFRWSASETAGLLETSVTAVNSALQRARTTLNSARPTPDETRWLSSRLTGDQRTLLCRYVEAIGQADAAAAVTLVRVDLTDATGAAGPFTERRTTFKRLGSTALEPPHRLGTLPDRRRGTSARLRSSRPEAR